MPHNWHYLRDLMCLIIVNNHKANEPLHRKCTKDRQTLSVHRSACLVYNVLIKIFAVLGSILEGGHAQVDHFITVLLLYHVNKSGGKKHS